MAGKSFFGLLLSPIINALQKTIDMSDLLDSIEERARRHHEEMAEALEEIERLKSEREAVKERLIRNAYRTEASLSMARHNDNWGIVDGTLEELRAERDAVRKETIEDSTLRIRTEYRT